ncbi:hypothetical protein GTO10_03635, partial [Candidatus Saccharibacteria bacterium]|nr:hypothetical protein [Candidatus Saccharibacteria bacterium]
PGAQATVKDLYQAYKDWCDRNGEKPLSKRSVGVHLADRGFKKGQQTTGGRARFWEGIGLQAV